MRNSVVLDTSVIVDFLRSTDKRNTILYKLSKTQAILYISLITHTELYAGKSVWENPKARRELETLFNGINLILLSESISKSAGKIRANYDVNLFDAIIAATSVEKRIPLLSLNTKHFIQLPGLKLYETNF